MTVGYRMITELFVQKYEHYLPTAFNEQMSLLQKVNKILEQLAVVIQNTNEFGELISDTVNTHVSTIASALQAQDLEISELYSDVETFKEFVANEKLLFEQKIENELLPSSVGITLDEWLDNGKLATIINDEVFDMKEDKVGLMLNNGRIHLPSDFPVSNLMVTREGKRDYKHGYNPYNIHDWSTATKIYIVANGATASGTDANVPITLLRFKANLLDGGITYGTQTNFIVTFLENVFNANGGFANESLGFNILFRSGSNSGFTWVGRTKLPNGVQISPWSSNSGVYSTTIIDSPTHVIVDIVNLRNVDEYGMPKPYTKVNTLSECQTTKGTFYQISSTVYVNPYINENVLDLTALVDTALMRVTNNNSVIVYENLGFLSSSSSFAGLSITSKYHYFGCKFYRGGNDAFGVTGSYQVFLYDSVSAYGNKDGFNYHTTNPLSLAVEINCVSYGNGMKKMSGGNQTTHSNNGSTAHDGMRMLRIGSKYWDCEGPIVADVNDCYSISIGCDVGDVLPSTTGRRSAYYLSDEFNTQLNPKYVIECLANGRNLLYGIYSDTNTNVYIMDNDGQHDNFGVTTKVDWKGVV